MISNEDWLKSDIDRLFKKYLEFGIETEVIFKVKNKKYKYIYRLQKKQELKDEEN